MTFNAVIVGAGKGERLKQKTPKCLIRIEGIPIILLAALPFDLIEEIESIVLVTPPGREEEIREAVFEYGFNKITAVTAGGLRRQDSVLNGLRLLPDNTDFVVIHDGARPLLSTRALHRFLNTLLHEDAAVVAVPLSDTIHKRDPDNYCLQGPDRSELVAAQTPQGFKLKMLRAAYDKVEKQGQEYTDETTLVRETMGVKVKIVHGERGNLKITHPDDLLLCRSELLRKVSILIGED